MYCFLSIDVFHMHQGNPSKSRYIFKETHYINIIFLYSSEMKFKLLENMDGLSLSMHFLFLKIDLLTIQCSACMHE